MSRLAIGFGVIGIGIKAGNFLEHTFGPPSISSYFLFLVVTKMLSEELHVISGWFFGIFVLWFFVAFCWVLVDDLVRTFLGCWC